jgi:hypothetical protein
MNFRRKQIRRNKPFHFDDGIAIRGKKKQKKSVMVCLWGFDEIKKKMYLKIPSFRKLIIIDYVPN